MRTDTLGDRMKLYEGMEAGRRLMPLLPIIARIDGRAFSTFTRGMARPYDERMQAAMLATTVALVRETNACLGYTQSDEISLAWHSTDTKSSVWFDGRIIKMISQLGAQATLYFYREVCKTMPEYADRLPTFDARVWNVPNRTEGANVFLWREWDATKNSLSMAASAYFSHKELNGRDGKARHDLLHGIGINWNDYGVHFKRGVYVQRRTTTRPFTTLELDKLPPKHAARRDPALAVTRSDWVPVDMPRFSTVANREAVVFDGTSPVVTVQSVEEASDAQLRDIIHQGDMQLIW